MDIQRRFLELRRNPFMTSLPYPGSRLTRSPLSSWGYRNCNGVVLLSDDQTGLTHYDLEAETPDIYLNNLIDQMEVFPKKAVVIGGDKDHLMQNLAILKRRGIPLANIYTDGWNTLPKPISSNARIGLKDLIVVPKTEEVLILNRGEFSKLN